jgi:sugar transferase EpsL
VKRFFDLAVTSLGLVLISPLLIVIAIMSWAKHGSPVIFCQQRPGLGGKPFMMYKFRTMTNQYDSDGSLLPDEERLTDFGKFMRSTSLDELPELINVLKGEMSLVGPRPLLMEYLPLYTREQARRHEVRPGISGWAQVNGRNAISWDDKFKLDVWYVDNQSIWIDMKILFLTVKKVVVREGISAQGYVSAEKFKGNSR